MSDFFNFTIARLDEMLNHLHKREKTRNYYIMEDPSLFLEDVTRRPASRKGGVE